VLLRESLYKWPAMRDPRIDEYARLLVDRSVGVQPEWQVLVRATPLARPLVEAVMEQVARRGAHPIVQLAWETVGGPFAREAPLDLLGRPAPLQVRIWEECDAFIMISAPENAREGSDLSEERRQLLQRRAEPLRRRQMAMEVPWVICEYPTNAGAQEAGLTLHEYEEFVYGAVLLDWDAESRRLAKIAEIFDAAGEVRIVGELTDLTLSLAGRTGAVDDGHINMPGGEVFYSPLESSAEGEVTFCEFPAVYWGHEVSGVRFVFREGRIVEASAVSGEDFLLAILDTDEGARRLGELGIGSNPGIQRFSKNVGFDEKIDGTIHLAIGNSYSSTGGTNVSAVHWDIVKDLRVGGRIYADGQLVQEDGRWTVF
jgi:aminopeptidase